LVLLLAPVLLAGLAGCTRRFFRNAADHEVDAILAEKDKYGDWKIDDYYIYPDPRSRFADWTNPDRPPMPPDDPAAHDMAPDPQKPGKKGVQLIEGTGYLEMLAAYDKENRARIAKEEKARQEEDNPLGEAEVAIEKAVRAAGEAVPPEEQIRYAVERSGHELALPVTRDGPLPDPEKRAGPRPFRYIINLEQCVQLALINSREFQLRREQLYLATLPVTLERFSFAAQFQAFGNAIRERSGSETPQGEQNRWTTSATTGFGKLFSTGALLLTSFANQTVYNLGNGPPTVSTSTISLDLLQPLLRGGGKTVTLEPLTQMERNLLYSIRDYMKFRQEFFVFIAAGQSAFIPGVQPGVTVFSGGTVATAGAFVPTGGPSTTGGAGAGGGPVSSVPVNLVVVPGSGGRFGPLGVPGATPQGYLGTVSDQALLVNAYRNIQSLQRFLKLFRVYLEGGIVNSVQVGTVEQSLLQSTESTLGTQNTYIIDLDQLKQQIGLPITLNLEVDDAPLRPMIDQTRRFENVTNASEDLSRDSLQAIRTAQPGQVRERLRRLFQTASLARGTSLPERIKRVWSEWEKLPRERPGAAPPGALQQRLDRLREERRRLLDRRAELEAKSEQLPEADQRRLGELDFELDVARFERSLRVYEDQPWRAEREAARRDAVQASLAVTVHRFFLTLFEVAFEERYAQIGKRWPALPSLCVNNVDLLSAADQVAMDTIAQATLQNRLDLMNQRAQLVDSWRKIAVAANALMGVFNVEYHFDSYTPQGGRQPLNFGGPRNRNQLILNTQLPLVRISERNNYRSALIAYQQQRRQLQLAEDDAIFGVRLDLRTLRIGAFNYQNIQKRAIELAYRQVDQALQAFSQPQAPAGPGLPPGIIGPPTTGGGAAGAADPAALTQQLLSAQSSLVRAQNDLYGVWIGYIIARMDLYRDLGLMPLDSRGVWIDDIANCDCNTNGSQPGTGATPGAPAAGEPERLRTQPKPVAPPQGTPDGPGR
jgi:hypothetical protein